MVPLDATSCMLVQKRYVLPPELCCIHAYSSHKPPGKNVLLGTPAAVTNEPNKTGDPAFAAIERSVCAPVFGTVSKLYACGPVAVAPSRNNVKPVDDPCGPVSPVGPCIPCGPVQPVGPVGPCIPCGPVSPVGPWIPCGPVHPVGPVGPCMPCGPVGP